MAEIYNPDRTPLPVTLSDGSSTSIPGKGRLVVADNLLGSSDIAQKRKKGQLVLRFLAQAPILVVAEPLVEAAIVSPAPAAAEVVVAVPVVEAVVASAVVVPETTEVPVTDASKLVPNSSRNRNNK